MTSVSLPWAYLQVGPRTFDRQNNAQVTLEVEDSRVLLRLSGAEMGSIEIRMHSECIGWHISDAEEPQRTVLVLKVHLSRPMTQRVCSFWNRNNEHVCQRDIAIYFDQKQRSWSFRKFEDFTDCLEEEMAGGSINFISGEEVPPILHNVRNTVETIAHTADTIVARWTRNDTVTLGDYNRLANDWLNDTLVDFGFWYFHAAAVRRQPQLETTFKVMTTKFMTKLRQEGPKKVEKWTKHFDVFDVQYIAFPVHTAEKNHWYLIIIDRPGWALSEEEDRFCRVVVLDSLRRKRSKDVEMIRKWLSHMSRRGEGNLHVKEVTPKVLIQPNGNDCGAYCIHFLDIFLENPVGVARVLETCLNAGQIDNLWQADSVQDMRKRLQAGLRETALMNWVQGQGDSRASWES